MRPSFNNNNKHPKAHRKAKAIIIFTHYSRSISRKEMASAQVEEGSEVLVRGSHRKEVISGAFMLMVLRSESASDGGVRC